MGTLWDRYRANRVPTVQEILDAKQAQRDRVNEEFWTWSRRGRERADLVRGGRLVYEPHQGPPHIRLPGSRVAYCKTCAPMWHGGAWYWELPGLMQHVPWQCVLCCMLNLIETSECLCCGLPRSVGLMLAQGLWK